MPRREFWCHPLVTAQLREETWWRPASRSSLWNLYDLYGCPVYEDPLMTPGAWEFREGGSVTTSGNIWLS